MFPILPHHLILQLSSRSLRDRLQRTNSGSSPSGTAALNLFSVINFVTTCFSVSKGVWSFAIWIVCGIFYLTVETHSGLWGLLVYSLLSWTQTNAVLLDGPIAPSCLLGCSIRSSDGYANVVRLPSPFLSFYCLSYIWTPLWRVRIAFSDLKKNKLLRQPH